jgi:hypothetical protein
MPTGSSDGPVTEPREAGVNVNRYGVAGFVAACVNMLLLEFITWVFLPWFLVVPYVLVPVLAVDALICGVLMRMSGRASQIGRGMLIACSSAPLTAILAITTIIVAHAVGPL